MFSPFQKDLDTVAETLPEKVSPQEKDSRSKRLIELSEIKNSEFINLEFKSYHECLV